MKIYAPVKDFNGWRNNVRFVNGVGETDNPQMIEWFQSHGYEIVDESHIITVEKCDEVPEKSLEKCDEMDFDNMTPLELRDWAKAHGLGGVIKNTRNKEKLLELIRG